MEAYMPFLLWGGLFVLTVLVEFATQQLVSIWFAAGSLAAFLAVCFGASLPVQGSGEEYRTCPPGWCGLDRSFPGRHDHPGKHQRPH